VNEKVENTIDNYSNLLFRKPGTVLIIAVIFTAIVASGASNVETVEQNQEDLLPDSLPTMQAFSTISAEFSSDSGTTYTVLVEANPQYSNSNEIRDLRNPEAIRFMRAVSNDIESVDRVSSVSSGSDLFQDIPSDKQGVQNVFNRLGEPRWQNYISEDYQNGLVRVNTVDLTAEEQMEMADTIRTTVEAHEKPSGLDVGYTGQPYIDEAFQNQTNQTMSLTGIAALLGVIIVVVVLFRSFFYGATSLITLIFGVATGFGLFGWLGLNMSPATSGAITMGIGVAIDFGIQPIARYIEERQQLEIEGSVSETIKGVITPMTVGLIAANIGFLSLNVGRVTFLSDLGTLLTLTTTMAYISAFTVIPPALILYDRYFTENGTSGFTLSKIRLN
jgi:hypothetical protein